MKYQPLVSLAFALPVAVSASPFLAGRDVCKPVTVTKTITVDSWDAVPTAAKDAGVPSGKPAVVSSKPGNGAPPVDIQKWVQPSYGCGGDGKRLCPPKDSPVTVYACGHDGTQKCVIEKWIVIVYTCGSDGKQLCAPPDWTRPEYTCGHDGKQLCLPEPHPQCGHGYPGPCCQPPPSSCGYNGQPCSSVQPTSSTTVESTSTVVITSTSTVPGTSTFPTSTPPFGNGTTSSVSDSSTSSSVSVSETTSSSSVSGTVTSTSTSSTVSSTSSSVSGTVTSTSTSSTVSSTSSTSSAATPTSTCGIVGYDKGTTPTYWYDGTGAYGTFAACSSACATNGCVSFGVGNNACLLYNVSVTQNVNPVDGSPYTFYESTCATPSTSSVSVSATPTSSSSSIVDSTSTSVTPTSTSSSATSTPTSSSTATDSTSASVTPTPTSSSTDTPTSTSTPTNPTSTSECVPTATPISSPPAGAKCGVKGGQGTPDLITSFSAASLGECAEQCFYTWDKPCQSVGYDSVSTVCQLYAGPISDVNSQYGSFDNYDKACFVKKDCPGSVITRRRVRIMT